MSIFLEIILIVVIFYFASMLTKKAMKNNRHDAKIQRSINQNIKLTDLNQEILDFYRKDLTGFFRFPITSEDIDGLQIRYDFYVGEMKKNGTHTSLENKDIAKSTQLAIQKLSDKIDLQERINAIVGDEIFSNNAKDVVEFPDLSEVVVDSRLFEYILVDFRAFQEVYEKVYYHNENISEEKIQTILENLNQAHPYTTFTRQNTLTIIESDDWGVFVQKILENLTID